MVLAASEGNVECLKLLLEAGADKEAKDVRAAPAALRPRAPDPWSLCRRARP